MVMTEAIPMAVIGKRAPWGTRTEAVGVKRSEKVPWEGLRCGEETGTRLPYLRLPLPTIVFPESPTQAKCFDHTRGGVCVGGWGRHSPGQSACLGPVYPPLQLSPPAPFSWHSSSWTPLPPPCPVLLSLFLSILLPCLGSYCALPGCSPVKHLRSL